MRPFLLLATLFILAEVVMISGCAIKESPDPSLSVPTQDQAIDAIRRSHPHSLQVCYDSVNDGFMIQYRDLLDGEQPDAYMHGWQWLKNEKIFRAKNGSWFTVERAPTDYVKIFPDVFNLPCKKT